MSKTETRRRTKVIDPFAATPHGTLTQFIESLASSESRQVIEPAAAPAVAPEAVAKEPAAKKPRAARKPRRHIKQVEAKKDDSAEAMERAIVRNQERQKVREQKRKAKQVVSKKKPTRNAGRGVVVRKRRRDGGKAAGKHKPTRKQRINGVEDSEDAVLGPEWYLTSRASIRSALNEPVSLSKVVHTYPEMDFDVLRNIPDNFTGNLRLPPPYTMENNVTTHRIGNGLVPFMDFVSEHECLAFNPNTFAAATVHVPECTALAFRSRSMVCAGTKSENEACLGAAKLELLFTKWNVVCSHHNFKVQNIVASASLGFPVDLELLEQWANKDREYGVVRYEEVFPGATFRVKNSRIVFLVFLPGKLVITGATSPAEISYALTWFYYTVLVRFRDDTLQVTSSEYRNSRKTRKTQKLFGNYVEEKKPGKKAQKPADDGYRDYLTALLSEDVYMEDQPNVVKEQSVASFQQDIERRRADLLRRSEESIREHGSDFGLRRFTEDATSVLWWDMRQKERLQKRKDPLAPMEEEDPRWYTCVCVPPSANPLFKAQDEVPLVDEDRYLCVQTVRFRHFVLTGHDTFDPRVLEMLIDCSRDAYGMQPPTGPFEIKPAPELFTKQPFKPPRSVKWESATPEVQNNLAALFESLQLHHTPAPWVKLTRGEPPLPEYKRAVCNMYDVDAWAATPRAVDRVS